MVTISSLWPTSVLVSQASSNPDTRYIHGSLLGGGSQGICLRCCNPSPLHVLETFREFRDYSLHRIHYTK